jgi:hypothetical protein
MTKLNKTGAVTISQVLIGVMLLVAVVIGFATIMLDVTDQYGVSLENDTWDDSYDFVNSLNEISGEQASVATEADPDTSSFEPFSKVVSAFRKVGQAFGMFHIMISTFFNSFAGGAATSLIAITYSLIAFVIIFAILSAIWKYQL